MLEGCLLYLLLKLTKPEKIVSISLMMIFFFRKYTYFCGPGRLGQQALLFRSMISFLHRKESTFHFAENTNFKLSYNFNLI